MAVSTEGVYRADYDALLRKISLSELLVAADGFLSPLAGFEDPLGYAINNAGAAVMRLQRLDFTRAIYLVLPNRKPKPSSRKAIPPLVAETLRQISAPYLSMAQIMLSSLQTPSLETLNPEPEYSSGTQEAESPKLLITQRPSQTTSERCSGVSENFISLMMERSSSRATTFLMGSTSTASTKHHEQESRSFMTNSMASSLTASVYLLLNREE